MPISAQLKYNVDVVCEYIVNKIPIPERNFVAPPNMIVIRSFDVNKPGAEVDDIKGGVAGGSILRVCTLAIYLAILLCCWCLLEVTATRLSWYVTIDYLAPNLIGLYACREC